MAGLTVNQEAFAQSIASGEFDFQWRSYEKCYSTKNMAQNSIYVETCKLLQNPKISLRIKEIRDAILKRNEVTLDEVLKELADWLRFDPIEFFDENNCMKDIHDLTPVARKQIADIRIQETFANMDGHKYKTGEIKNIKFLDKQSTVDKFMKYFGAYIENHKISVEDLSHVKDLLDSIGK